MSTPSRYTALPPVYDGNSSFSAWEKRFRLCVRANAWSREDALLKLPTLLSDSALSTWVGLPDSDIATLDSALKALQKELSPETFVSFDLFQTRRWNENTESLDDYGFALGTLLDQSGLDLPTQARESLLTSRFISGLPVSIQKDMRKSREATTSFKEAVRSAKRLYTIQQASINIASPPSLQSPVNGNVPSVQALNGYNNVGTINAISDLANAMVSFINGKSRGHSGNANANSNRNQMRCDYCGIPGHKWRNCRKLQASLRNSGNPRDRFANGPPRDRFSNGPRSNSYQPNSSYTDRSQQLGYINCAPTTPPTVAPSTTFSAANYGPPTPTTPPGLLPAPQGNDNGTTTAEEAVAPNVMYLQRNVNESH